MAPIKVDPQDLRRVARELTGAVAVAREVDRHHDRMAAHAAGAGHPAVAAAIGSFLGRWAYGCHCLVHDAEAIAGALGSASEVYRTVEAHATERAG